MLIEGRDQPKAVGYEVVGRLDRGPRRIVVSTPYSAYLTAAGERGPGIAIWLALAQWAARRGGATSFTFVASSGHEMNGAGIRGFLAHAAPDPGSVDAWLHLGAAVAVRDFKPGPNGELTPTGGQFPTRLLTNRADFLRTIERNFSGLPYDKRLTTTAVGELSLFFERGYPTWGFEGGHAYHHAPNDLPFVTSPELLEGAARAIVRTVEEIESLPPAG